MKEYKKYFEVNGIRVYWDFKLLPKDYLAITLFDRIYCRKPKDELYEYLQTETGMRMVNHERIHMLQARTFKTGYFGFYMTYIWYWIKKLFKYGFDPAEAYAHIPFEIEAYQNDHNMDYNKSNWKYFRLW